MYSKEKKQQKEKKKQIHFKSQLQNYLVKQSIKLRYYLILICFLSLKKDTIPWPVKQKLVLKRVLAWQV